MSGFFSSMFTEMGARRKRLRAQFGDRGQALTEFLVLGGLAIGSVGLFVREWMPAAAPWGFALPFVFVVGALLIEARRQAAAALFQRRLPETNAGLDAQEWVRLEAEMRADERSAVFQEQAKEKFDAEADARRQYRTDNPALIVAPQYDWAALLWGFACALAGAAAFVIAWSAEPPPVDDGIWRPPEGSVASDIVPVEP
jgi:CHASE2 domain-containing sensor protein